MSSETLAVWAEDLGKRYDVYDRPSDRLRQFFLPHWHRFTGREPSRYGREFWALRGISFELPRGSALGIVGRNGSGKSTLLQLVTGILRPTEGSIEVQGRVAALLELGSGFNPDFTGRENVYLNAALLGLHRAQVDARFDRIAAFADIGDFIEQPVKTYSSGMFVRLAFAVVAHVDADILIVDEALAVGDAFFSQKCMRFFRTFRENGGTLLFVSHDSGAVTTLCSRALWLERGTKRGYGEPEAVCRQYLRQLYADRENTEALTNVVPDAPVQFPEMQGSGVTRVRRVQGDPQTDNPIAVSTFNAQSEAFGLGAAKIVDAGFFDEEGARRAFVNGGENVRFSMFIECVRSFDLPATGLVLKDRLGQALFTETSTLAYQRHYIESGLRFEQGERIRVDYRFPMPVLFPGDYTMTVAIAEGLGHEHVQQHLIHDALALKSVRSRLLHGIAGFSSIDIEMTFFRQSETQGESVRV